MTVQTNFLCTAKRKIVFKPKLFRVKTYLYPMYVQEDAVEKFGATDKFFKNIPYGIPALFEEVTNIKSDDYFINVLF